MSDDHWQRAREDQIHWRHQDWDRQDRERRAEADRAEARRGFYAGDLAWTVSAMLNPKGRLLADLALYFLPGVIRVELEQAVAETDKFIKEHLKKLYGN